MVIFACEGMVFNKFKFLKHILINASVLLVNVIQLCLNYMSKNTLGFSSIKNLILSSLFTVAHLPKTSHLYLISNYHGKF